MINIALIACTKSPTAVAAAAAMHSAVGSNT